MDLVFSLRRPKKSGYLDTNFAKGCEEARSRNTIEPHCVCFAMSFLRHSIKSSGTILKSKGLCHALIQQHFSLEKFL